MKANKIVKVLIGSANFSSSGLYTPRKEVLGDISNGDFSKTKKYINIVKNNSQNILDYSPKEGLDVIQTEDATLPDTEINISLLASKKSSLKNIVGISTESKGVHSSAGLNWGFSNAAPSPNDAYIAILSKYIKKKPLLFPQKDKRTNMPIDVIWDDGVVMQMLLEGSQTIDRKIYPKQISTYRNKSEIGIYLRRRIGEKINKELILPLGMSKVEFKQNAKKYADKLITKEMLDAYGRNSISVKLIGDKTYYFDFSTK